MGLVDYIGIFYMLQYFWQNTVVVCAQTSPLSEMMQSSKCSSHVSKLQTLMINTIDSTLSNPEGVHFSENDITFQ
jgi:hypothetical protein